MVHSCILNQSSNAIRIKTLNYKHLINYINILLRIEDAKRALFINLLCHPKIKASRPYVKACFTEFTLLWCAFQAGITGLVSFNDPSVLSSRGQNMWMAADCLFTGEAGQWRAVWTDSKPIATPPVPTADHSSSLTSNTVCYFSPLPPQRTD